jgi:hypothetical protein
MIIYTLIKEVVAIRPGVVPSKIRPGVEVIQETDLL